ncbi:MATE family efflux transporter DinF [Agarivorans sp. TSD2052]|uniref:MATE family efflux transporter DinF n=1 Tax=Agarivorans sp. TSD2052 TaxID=2937286 RepID=UPI00200C6DCA|nr:MATE family efflux transporter DinF [Agarivorans sp. TSD2052]UPW18858.1 MATE family efflux transporter DinF [Agarivorans sp. TSD2052]
MHSSRFSAIAAIAIPMILSNITIPLLGLVDTAVIGHLDHSYYLAGVALGSMMITLVFWLCGFLRMSTTGLAAQASGANDRRQLIHLGINSGLIALSLGLTLLLLQTPILDLGMRLAGGSEQVQFYAREYFATRIWGAPAALLNMVLLGWLLGMQNARAPMLLVMLTNSLNIALDVLLVVGFDMNVFGAALATVISDYLGLAVGLYLCRQQFLRRFEGLPDWAECFSGFNRLQLGGLFRLNRDIFVRSLALQACFAFITFQGSRLGDNIVAANAVLLNFLMFVSFGLDGLAYAVEALAGKAKGQQDRQQFVSVINRCLLLALFAGIGFSGLFAVFGEALVALLTDIADIRTTANQYLPWMVLLPLVAVWCFILDGVFIATAEGRIMRNSMLLASVAVFFPLWWLSQAWGNHALWFAMSGFMAARGLSLGYIYYRALIQHRWFKAP